MSKERIIITIDKEGKTSIEGFGFIGTDCEKQMAAFVQAFGPIKHVQKKPEYYATGQGSVSQSINQ